MGQTASVLRKGDNYEVTYLLAGLSLSVLLSACAVVNTARDIAPGRQAMLARNYQLALDYFWVTDQMDPHYTYGAWKDLSLSF